MAWQACAKHYPWSLDIFDYLHASVSKHFCQRSAGESDCCPRAHEVVTAPERPKLALG